MYNELGDRRQALAFYKQAPPIRREVSDRAGEAVTRYNMAMIHRADCDLVAAVASAFGAPTPASAADLGVYGVYNDGSLSGGVALGVIVSGWPVSQKYDYTLPAGPAVDNGTGRGVFGVYIGPGYCAQKWKNTNPYVPGINGPGWTRAGADWPTGKYQLAGAWWVKVVPYRC